MTTSFSSNHFDKNDEINNKINTNPELEIGRKTKISLSNEELFENIKEDDENYYKFKEYIEDDFYNF